MATHLGFLEPVDLAKVDPPRSWLWDGLLMPGRITLFTAMWKTGKTTLLSHLLAQRKAGGALADRAVTQGANAVITEEPAGLWNDRHARLGFGPRDCFFCRPFKAQPAPTEWQELLYYLETLRNERGVDLVVIDPLAYFLPVREENNASLLLEAMRPLRQLAESGQAVLLLHHPRKAPSARGMASRGSSILPAFVDILLEMYLVNPADVADRRRRLLAFSRDPATPRSLVIELSEDGAAYRLAEDIPDDPEYAANWSVLRMVLADAPHELTRQEIQDAWPGTFPTPSLNTLWRWLSHAVEKGDLHHLGAGNRHDPFRYYLQEKVELWQHDVKYQMNAKMRESRAELAKLFGREL